MRFRQAGGGLAGAAYYARLARECARAGARVTVLVALAQAAVAAGVLGELAARAGSAR